MLNNEEQFFAQIDEAQQIAVVFSKDWFGDSVGSGLALYHYLKKLGKTVTLIADPTDRNQLYSFLPGYDSISEHLNHIRQFIISLSLENGSVDKVKYKMTDNELEFLITPKQGTFSADDVHAKMSGYDYDLIITVNSPDLESLGLIYEEDTEFFYQTKIINIDNHSANDNYGQINLINLKAVATAEILLQIFHSQTAELISADIATCLLTGIISQTKSFKTENVTPQALSHVSDLISFGADRELIIKHLYRNRSLGVLKLWGKILANLQSQDNNKIIWSQLHQNDLIQTKTNREDLISVIDELIISIPQAAVILIFVAKPDSTSAIIYAVKNLDSLELTKEFNPQGNKKLAQLNITEPIKAASEKVLASLMQKISKLNL